MKAKTSGSVCFATAPNKYIFSLAGADICSNAESSYLARLYLRTPICTVKRFVGQGEFGEVYEVVWAGVGKDRGATMAMKTVRLADVSSEKRDECRILLIEEILTVRRTSQQKRAPENDSPVQLDCFYIVRFSWINHFSVSVRKLFLLLDTAIGCSCQVPSERRQRPPRAHHGILHRRRGVLQLPRFRDRPRPRDRHSRGKWRTL